MFTPSLFPMTRFTWAITILLFFFLPTLSRAQVWQKYNAVGFKKLPETVLKRELSWFGFLSESKLDQTHLIKKHLQKFPMPDWSDTSAFFSLDKTHVSILAAPLDTTRQKLKFGHSRNHYWGTDGTVPTTWIKSITYSVGGKTIALPQAAINDLYQPGFCFKGLEAFWCHCHVYQSLDKKRLYIYMQNGDGAGSYGVIWVVVNGVLKMRIVDYLV